MVPAQLGLHWELAMPFPAEEAGKGENCHLFFFFFLC